MTIVLEPVMIALEEGGEWLHVAAHSLVLDGKRWDAINRTWAPYELTPEEIKEAQREGLGTVLVLVKSYEDKF
jgi:hypothetical protein